MSYSKHNFKKGDRLYASQLNEIDDAIASMETKTISSVGASANQVPTADGNGGWTWENQQGATTTHLSDFGLAYVYWTQNLSSGDLQQDINDFAEFDLVMVDPNLNETSLNIIAEAKKLNPNLRLGGYLESASSRMDNAQGTALDEPVMLNSDGSWEGSSAQEAGCMELFSRARFVELLAQMKAKNYDMVFYDDWGFDFTLEAICYQMGYDTSTYSTKAEALNQKYADLIDIAHDAGLGVCTNGEFQSDVGDWWSHFTEDDVICWESCLVTSAGNKWMNGQTKLYNYFANYYTTGLCKAKSWSLDYMPEMETECDQEADTFEIVMALCSGAHYVSSAVDKRMKNPDFFSELSSTATRSIEQINNYIYIATIGTDTIKTVKNSSLGSSVVSEANIGLNYSILNGMRFNNAYIDIMTSSYSLSEKIDTLDTTLATMGDDNRKNAGSFWRLCIDDWGFKNIVDSYTNIGLEFFAPHAWSGFYSTSDDELNSATIENTSVTFTEDGWHGLSIFEMWISDAENADYRGMSIEVGASEFSSTVSNMDPRIIYTTASTSGNIYQQVSISETSIFDVSQQMCIHWTIPDDCTYFRVYLRSPSHTTCTAGTITAKNLYMVDVNEHADEVSKKWYTQLYKSPDTVNASMGVTASTYLYNGRELMQLNLVNYDGWAWCYTEIPYETIESLRGHTIEIGIISAYIDGNSDAVVGTIDTSTGVEWYDIGLAYTLSNGLPQVQENGIAIRMSDSTQKSSIFDEKLHCKQLTIDDSIDTLYFGIRCRSITLNTVCVVQGIYCYDVDEEGLSIRGVTTTNSSLRVCRVDSATEELTPSKIGNSIYFDENGNVWCLGIDKERTDIAGGIYAGAKEAGYTGTPNEFGAALYNLISGS